jgi:putative redox protein
MATITTTYKGRMLFETEIGEHTVVTDVPLSMGGADRAPFALDLFVATLGACISSFVAQYCERNGIDDTGMAVDMSFDKVPNPVRIINMKATVKLPNGDPGQRREAIERVAEHCPVHETIRAWQGLQIQVLGKGEIPE